jgi:perosamine synthetase
MKLILKKGEFMWEKMILTAGPSISTKEINYVTDAVTHGWNEHWNDYIIRFEKKFSEYIGVKHALTTSSCTGALHLALAALDLKKGDEVIVPDLSWIATASVVRYVNAEPVFADVRRDSWCIDPESIITRITPRTKAIIPVHLYGQPANMPEIIQIADKYGLKVIEDAAPSIGAELLDKRTGSWGDIAGFSFQGAKLLVTGEGGMLVTNDTKLFNKMKHFAEHGRSSQGFTISDIGFKYKMSNIQAALGLAQLERIEELIKKKITIYNWYKTRLANINGLSMNKQNDANQRSIYWMSSIILDKDFGISRNEIMTLLKKKNIDTRPTFPKISSFNMFKEYDNPISEHISLNGINLPSGHDRTEEEIDYVCETLKTILHI